MRSGSPAPQLVLWAMALLLAALAGPCRSQQPPVPPTPGALLEGIGLRHPAIPGGAPAEFLFPQEASPSTHDRSGRRFLVKGFHFVGNTVFTEARLRRVVERFTDLQLNLHDLNKASDAVSRFYREMGFPVAGAFIPVQKVEDGLVIMNVIEGRMGALVFEGGWRYSDATLGAYMAPLLEQPQVTIGQLERSLLLMNDLPGLKARATLAPGAARGETDATIALEEKPLALTAQFNNWGRKEAGANRLDIGVELNNPLGIGDQLTWRGMKAEQGLMHYNRIGYSIPLGADGLRFSIGGSSVRYKVAGDFALLGIEGLVNSSEMGLSYALRRSRVSNIMLSAGIKSTQSRQTALNTPLSSSRLRVLSLGVAANWVHEDSSNTSLSTTYSSNFRKNYGNNPDALRGKVDIDFTHLAGLSPRWDVFTRFNTMLGAGSVPDTEKFSIGGPDSVRGYRSAEYRGDRGYLFSVEFRRQFLLLNTVGIYSIFHDRGGVRNSGFASQDNLSSWGTGVTLFPRKESRIRADIAWPTSDKNRPAGDGKSGARLWLSASISF
ncbi:MAG: ShlB/FhaC/HecB family hemolysin secretion/activation protein [Rhodocyclaceae bacterium]|nr:ShlB/FhaC/HecB family hemolysin secretion/activation protein [Rhodocyclaceae bacterium]